MAGRPINLWDKPAFEDYTIEDTTTDQGNAAKRIAAGNAEVIFTVDNGKEYLIGADGQGYECEDVTADMAAKIIEENMK